MAEQVIELGRENASKDVFCIPNGNTYRGKHVQGREGRLMAGATPPPSWPGIRIGIDVRKKCVRIFDPLTKDQRTVEAINKANKTNSMPEIKPLPEERITDLKDEDLAHWAWWMRRVVSDGEAVYVTSGEIPELIPADKLFDFRGNVRRPGVPDPIPAASA